MKNQLLEMKINPNDKTTFNVKIPVGSESYGFGLLIHDFAASELSGSEEGVELKTYRWMQEQTHGTMDDRQIARSIEGWRMRMRRKFLEWGKVDGSDCWDYIPVDLRLWCDQANPSEKWRESPVLFLWRCHLWQARLRGCDEAPICPPILGDDDSLWEDDYGWLYGPIDNKVIWTLENRSSFDQLPSDVAEYLTKDWIVRLENPSASEIWDQDYNALGEMENEYRFDEWTGPENWIPTPFIEEKGLLEKWRSLTKP